jgi:serine/threonine-protein kinase
MPSPSSVETSLTYPAVADATLGRYRLFAKLGSGGQADVFLAIARGTLGVDKLVVIKRARAEVAGDAAQLGIFVDEARLTLRLNHPNLVHTYEVGEERGAHFISMEHVEGLSLRALFRADRTRSFGAAIWLRVIADALSGLAHAHGLRDYDGRPLGVVHRDISPHNIIVSYDGVTKLIDFGIATSRDGAGGDPGVVTGKVAYMAPERALGAPADRRSDLFAMGVVLWEMLSRRRMFDGDPQTILQQLARDPIPRLGDVVAEIDAELHELVARALDRDPAARYQTATEMRHALEAYMRRAGHLVREPEVGEAMAAAFHDVRRELRAQIQTAMSRIASDPPLRASEAAVAVDEVALSPRGGAPRAAAMARGRDRRCRRRVRGHRRAGGRARDHPVRVADPRARHVRHDRRYPRGRDGGRQGRVRLPARDQRRGRDPRLQARDRRAGHPVRQARVARRLSRVEGAPRLARGLDDLPAGHADDPDAGAARRRGRQDRDVERVRGRARSARADQRRYRAAVSQ